MSLTAMVVLLGCSVGCVSFEHHFNRHSVVAHVAERQAGRYYHCPHCGQIIPREGFSKCPRCFQVPAYHGYEPTCWRQWPQGWGCPPEPVVNNPKFWEQGMVESDAVEEELPPHEDQPQRNQSQPPMDEQGRHLPDAEPGRSEVLRPPLPRDVASVREDLLPDSESESGWASEPAGEIASSDLTRSTDVSGSTEQPLGVDPSDLDQLDLDSSVLSEQQIASDNPPLATPDTDFPCFNFDEEEVTDIAQVEPSAITQYSIPEPVQLDMPIETAEVAIDTTTPAPSETIAVANQPEPEMVTSVPQASPLATDIQEDAVPGQKVVDAAEPEFGIVSRRIPVPTSKSLLTSEDVSDQGEGAGELNDPPSLVRCSPKVIEVEDQDVVAESEASLKVAQETAPKMTLHDELGPLPVREVQLAEIEKDPSTSSVTKPAEPVAEETYPVPVHRIALPKPRPAQVPGEYHPTPVRRIQLSELPIRIQR